ncbi:MAG: GNAT family N-acetyltransferase [Solobacterium sp.]|nr:GNAT family N-acetyltransferase [Solobacterium sp.]
MMETERLILRPFSEEDLDLVLRLYGNREIMRYMPYDVMDKTEAEEHLQRLIAGWQEDPVLNREYAVIRKDSGKKIGRCHIQIDPETDTGMLGWLLVQKEWDQGYATEMTYALMDYCFHELGLHRVDALCNPDNDRSRRVLEKCGLRLEAHYREKCRYVRNGEAFWQDELEYALLKKEAEQCLGRQQYNNE